MTGSSALALYSRSTLFWAWSGAVDQECSFWVWPTREVAEVSTADIISAQFWKLRAGAENCRLPTLGKHLHRFLLSREQTFYGASNNISRGNFCHISDNSKNTNARLQCHYDLQSSEWHHKHHLRIASRRGLLQYAVLKYDIIYDVCEQRRRRNMHKSGTNKHRITMAHQRCNIIWFCTYKWFVSHFAVYYYMLGKIIRVWECFTTNRAYLQKIK